MVDTYTRCVAAHIGITTGIDPAWRGAPARALAHAADVGPVLEISALRLHELEAAIRLARDAQALAPFTSVSLHAPKDGVGTAAWTDRLAALPERIERIVVHPDQPTCGAWAERLGPRLCLENMDGRSGIADTPEKLDRLLTSAPKATCCLDLAHAGRLDPSGSLAHELAAVAGPRLVQLHLSSICRDGAHQALRAQDLVRDATLLESLQHLPWVLEAWPLPSAWEVLHSLAFTE